MSISLHSASVPIFVRMLGNLTVWLDKAELHAQARKFDPSVYMAARLAPDMLPFVKQVQIACDAAKSGVARLAQIDAPKFADDEATLTDLRARIAKTMDFVASVAADRIDGGEERDVTMPTRTGSITLKGEAFLQRFVLPNFFFHVTTAYALLRHNGVELGKSDFLGALS